MLIFGRRRPTDVPEIGPTLVQVGSLHFGVYRLCHACQNVVALGQQICPKSGQSWSNSLGGSRSVQTFGRTRPQTLAEIGPILAEPFCRARVKPLVDILVRKLGRESWPRLGRGVARSQVKLRPHRAKLAEFGPSLDSGLLDPLPGSALWRRVVQFVFVASWGRAHACLRCCSLGRFGKSPTNGRLKAQLVPKWVSPRMSLGRKWVQLAWRVETKLVVTFTGLVGPENPTFRDIRKFRQH